MPHSSHSTFPSLRKQICTDIQLNGEQLSDILRQVVHFSPLIFFFLQVPAAAWSPIIRLALICFNRDPGDLLTPVAVLTSHSKAEEGVEFNTANRSGWKSVES